MAWAYAFTRIYTRPVTRVAASYWVYQNIPAPLNLRIQIGDNAVYQEPLAFPSGSLIGPQSPYVLPFMANATGTLHEIYFPHVAGAIGAAAQTMKVSIGAQSDPSPDQPLATASLTSDFSVGADQRGREYRLALDHPLNVVQGQVYLIRIDASGGLTLAGAAAINESDWDDGLPLRLGVEGYDGFGGLYQGGLNLQIYYDDDLEKLARFVNILDQADYIVMSSNRQWGTLPRIPERFPMTSLYYRALLGCPADQAVDYCYKVAKPGVYQGEMGYELTNPEGTFYLLVRSPLPDDVAFIDLRDRGP